MSFHPMIGIYSRHIENITYLLLARRKLDSIKSMSNLIYQLKPISTNKLETVYKDLRTLENDCYIARNKIGNKFAPDLIKSDRITLSKTSMDDLNRYLGQIMKVMYEDGYFENATYGHHDPAGGRKSE